MAAASALGALSVAAASSPAYAASNSQNGLVNVNLQDIAVQAPVTVAVPVGIAADVCNVSAAVLAQQANLGQASCTATTTSTALNEVVAQQMTGGGSSSNQQSGLVNVNIQGLSLQVPVTVAVPIGVAANVCNISAAVLAAQSNAGTATCTATSTSNALNHVIARQMTA